jgi:FtsH-binding integral membrane protein
MLGIYNNMALGLVITGLTAFGIASTPSLYQPIFGTPLKWVAMFAPLAFVFFFSFRMERMTAASARTAFLAFSGVMGVSMAAIFLAYTETSIARTFFIAASMFLGMSLWGYTTKRDLTGWSSFLFMGLIGVVVASIVNIFLGSTTLQLVVSFAGSSCSRASPPGTRSGRSPTIWLSRARSMPRSSASWARFRST